MADKKVPKPTIAALQAEIARLEKLNVQVIDEKYEAKTALSNAKAAEKATLSHFADLKELLLAAETETARLRGYLARVHEDDIVRDGLVTIPTDDGKGTRLVPKRPAPMQTIDYGMAGGVVNIPHYDQFGARAEKRTHWTSY